MTTENRIREKLESLQTDVVKRRQRTHELQQKRAQIDQEIRSLLNEMLADEGAIIHLRHLLGEVDDEGQETKSEDQ